ncbi:MAG TPA: T9SS type A sorting domain-containing protein, partial [Candidatus Kapabacteria bacterium]
NDDFFSEPFRYVTRSSSGTYAWSPEEGGENSAIARFVGTDAPTSTVLNMNVKPNTISVFPNPFRSQTEIRFTVSMSGTIRFAVSDVLGREVFEQEQAATPGDQTISFDGSKLAPGTYYYRIESEEGTSAGMMCIER